MPYTEPVRVPTVRPSPLPRAGLRLLAIDSRLRGNDVGQGGHAAIRTRSRKGGLGISLAANLLKPET